LTAVTPALASDFSLDGSTGRLWFTGLGPGREGKDRWAVFGLDLATGRLAVVATAPSMALSPQISLTDQHCPLGAAYAQKHLTTPAKAAVLCCECACLRGEVARRASNLVTRALAPERAVRICRGGLLEIGGGMRELIEHSDNVLLMEGCAMSCGTRLLAGGMPDARARTVFVDQLFEFDRSLFSIEEMPEGEIQRHASAVAEKVVAEHLRW
jgi:hypothetical protein